MAEVSANLVKDLREKTGAGMMDCKKALSANDGDIEKAIDWLRAKGLSKAANKADRAAADGLVAVAVRRDGKGASGAAIELNSETDFVARNEMFQNAAASFAAIALSHQGALDAVLAAPAPDGEGAVQDMVTRLIATIGENITLRRTAALKVESGVVVPYMHNAVKDGLGKIGVLVALESDGDVAKLEEFGKKIAMHIAATAPAALSEGDIPAERIERERGIILESIKEDPKLAGKPQNVIDGAVTGKLRKVLQDIVLTKQAFVMNPDQTIEQAVEETAKALGQPVKLAAFVRFQLGDGVEKKTDDFAKEVAALTGQG